MPDVSSDTSKDSDKNEIPPLVDVKVSNPVTYLKLWWKKIIGNEGVDIKVTIKPITALLLVFVFTATGYGLGRITLPAPIAKYLPPIPTPTPTPSPWKETAYTGILQSTGGKYILVLGDGKAVILEVPGNVSLTPYVGKRILAVGKYNSQTEILVVSDASTLEVLIQSAPIPTASPTPTPLTVSPLPSATPQDTNSTE